MNSTKQRLLHHVTITVFCKPHDDKERVLHGLDLLSPVPTSALLAQEKEHDPEYASTVRYRMKDIDLAVQQTESDDGTMTIYALFFKKMHDVNAFAKKIVGCMTKEEKEQYHNNPESLLDAHRQLSLRLDKELLMADKLVLTDDGHCYQIKASIAAYPKTEESVSAVLRHLLGLMEHEHS